MHGLGGCRVRGAANGRHDRKKVDIDVEGNETPGRAEIIPSRMFNCVDYALNHHPSRSFQV
jgi:hypothetical protein